MAKFLKDSKLNSKIEELFEDAEEKIIIVSPFIKLHPRIKSYLNPKKKEDKLKITILFGKNEKDISKSFSKEEFDFFKEFPNIEIKYDTRLHAKYYASEKASLLSSMNLYDYSQNNNIEFGILLEGRLLDNINSFERDVDDYFEEVIKQGKPLFIKEPIYEKKMIRKKYIKSEIKIDELSNKFSNNYPEKKKSFQSQKKKPIKVKKNKESATGYCIRTGVEIPFNVEKPFSASAYKSWAKYGDPDYSEKYCHFSGEPSNGETSFSKPILKKNWKKAKAKFNL